MLTKKNKDLLKLVGAIFGVAVLAFAFMRAKKASADGKTTLADAAKTQVQALFTA